MCVIETIPFHPADGNITMANANEDTNIDAKLRRIFKDMEAHQAQEIREAYYKAMEGLMSLSEALEIADAQQEQTAGPLLDEHFNAAEALTAMRRSRLGAVL
jgi:dimeric dUTPase (all-alpha-NTP-PPase superfamily)